MSFGEAPSRARRVVVPGDVLVSTVRTYLRAIAHVDNVDDALDFLLEVLRVGEEQSSLEFRFIGLDDHKRRISLKKLIRVKRFLLFRCRNQYRASLKNPGIRAQLSDPHLLLKIFLILNGNGLRPCLYGYYCS